MPAVQFDDDRELQRNQLIATVLMLLVVGVWIFYTSSQAPPPQPPEQVHQEVVPSSDQGTSSEVPEKVPQAAAEGQAASAGSLAWLPPVVKPEEETPDDLVRITTPAGEGGSAPLLELTFTRIGARLRAARVVLGKDGADSAQLVPESGQPDVVSALPLGLRFDSNLWRDEVNRRRWDVEPESDPHAVTFSLTAPGRAKVYKRFVAEAGRHVVRVELGWENLSDTLVALGIDTREPAVALLWEPQVNSGDFGKGLSQQFVTRKEGRNVFTAVSSIAPPKTDSLYSIRELDPEWVALSSAYFVVAFRPGFEVPEDSKARPDGWITTTPDKSGLVMGSGAPRRDIQPGERAAWTWEVYIGPTARRALAAAWPGLDTVQRFFTSFDFMDWFAKFLLNLLNWFYDHVFPNYGLAIIFLTILVRVAVFPLTWKSMVSMKRMSQLAPELEKIKQEVGDDPQELQRRTMELYRERGINPLGGCLPIFLQLPVFFALYRMLWQAFELRRAPFLWITDLSEPDRLFTLPVAIPIPFSTQGIDAINLLPILGAVAILFSQELMPTSGPTQTPQQKMIMRIMPVIFTLFMYNLASGLNLYFLVSSLIGIAQNVVIQRVNIEPKPVVPRKPAARRRHFYNEAQARKRELAREMRREKEKRPRTDR
ncbi:MAG: membrane protein insertase YidC [Candidatus Hydrogenedentes bacterium]|nr:membrane protein insertase YidC [Candidatus Hydrogenedentota bacterium]